jgi:DNA polymerase-3 subunit alpha
MSDFTHLHVHSHYSLLDGLGKIEPMMARAKELGMTSLALTDHGALYGLVEFFQKAQAAGIKPILGVETYLAPHGHTHKRGKIDANPRHLTLLAQNATGYKNLLKLVTQAHLHGFYYKPRIDYELLEKHAEGLIVLSGCINGDIAQAILERRTDDVQRLLEWHLTLVGRDRFYLEVQHHPSLREQNIVNDALFTLSRKYKVGLVATADTHYIQADDAEAQDVLICVQTGRTVQEKDRLCMLGEDFSLKSPQEMKELWKEHPAAIDNTQKIAELCNVSLELGVNHLPRFPLPSGRTPDQALRQQSEAGLKQRYGDTVPPGTNERLEYELEVIQKTGFASYFLIVADFVNEAKRRGILVGPGRGSAAGSLVSYLLNITNLDPLQYDLLFERFLNPERVSMPDIDLDFADDRRDEVIEYVREKYGFDHVAQIITFGTMAARAAVRDAGRALAYPYAFCDTIAKAIPPFMNFKQALAESAELRELYEGDPQAKKLIDTARKLEGVCRHASTHAAGVVITEEPLTEYVSLQLSTAADGEHDTVTQFAMKEIEALGLLKMDFLGLKNLTIIRNTLRLIEKRHGVAIDLDSLPLDDAKTYQLLQAGQTTGVFQLESSGMKRYLKELKPTEFEDIISMLALYRPGPMDSIPDFIAGKHGQRHITYLHPILEPILQKTYGVIVTQDQVLQIARHFAGFSYAEADILRKAVGKKIKKLLDEQREKFIKGAFTAKQIDKKTAEKVWDFIEPFARYGFNRAHAACYAMIAFQTAYLKAHYPAEFMAAMLTSDQGNIDRAAIEVAEVLSLGIKILPPDINESDHDFTVVTFEGEAAIRFGLAGVKNVGDHVIDSIIAERHKNGPYTDLADLFRRVEDKTFNRKSVESLAQAGALDSVAERNYIVHNLDRLLEFNRALHRQRDSGQQGLFGAATVALSLPVPHLQPAPPAAKEERLRWEKELLGMYVSEHPLSEFQQELLHIARPATELRGLPASQSVRVAGVITQIKKIITKSQQPMLFVLLEDMVGKVEIVVFPSVLSKTSDIWSDGGVVVIEGKVSAKEGETKLLADKVWALTNETLSHFKTSTPQRSPMRPSPSTASRMLIRLPATFSKEKLRDLQSALAQHHLDTGLAVEIAIPHQGKLRTVPTSYRLTRSDELIQTLEQIVGRNTVTYT